MGFHGGSVAKNLPANVGDVGSGPGWGRSGEGNGNGKHLGVSFLGNTIEGGAWQASVHEIAKMDTS